MQRRRPGASCRLQPAAELSAGVIVISASLKPRLQIAVISKVRFLLATCKKSGGVPAALQETGVEQQ